MESCIIWCKKKNSDFFWKKDFTVSSLNALSHGETIIGTGMKYFSKASKAILYSYYLLYTVNFVNTAIAPIKKKNLDKYRKNSA